MSNPSPTATSPASLSCSLGVRPPALSGLSAELRVDPQAASISARTSAPTPGRCPRSWIVMDSSSERRGDGVEDLLLRLLVRRRQILFLVHPEDALLLPHAALDGDLRAARIDRLDHQAQP